MNSTCLQLKEEEALFVMHEFETFDCGLIKGQSFSEYECDLTFIFFEMHIKREIHSHQNDQTLLNILQPYYFLRPVIHALISIVALEKFC